MCVFFEFSHFFFCGVRFGTERLYAQKEDLLHEVLELEAEKGLLVSGDNTKYQVSFTGVTLKGKRYKLYSTLVSNSNKPWSNIWSV